MPRAVLRLVLLLAVAGAQPARAAPADAEAAKAEARGAVAEARAAYKAGRYAEAARGYLAAHRTLTEAGLKPPAGLLYNASLAHERLGDCDRVATLLRRFLAQAPERATPALKKRLAKAERCAPRVAISTEPSGAEVDLDGRVRGTAPLTLDLRPGSYTLTIRKPGFETARRAFSHRTGQPLALNFELRPSTRTVPLALEVGFDAEIHLDGERIARGPYRGVRRLAPGQHELRLVRAGCATQRITVELPDQEAPFTVRPPPACRPPVAAATPPPPPPETPAVTASTPAPSAGPGAGVWVVGGLGLAAAVAGGVFSGLHVNAASRRDRLADDPSVTTSETIRAADDEAFRWSVASGVAYGLAAAGLGTAIVLWLSGDDAPEAAALSPRLDGLAVRF